MKLNIINQSSDIELTSYQIAFLESILHLSRVIEDLPRNYFRGRRELNRLFPKDFILNIPIYLVNENDFVKIKDIYTANNKAEKEFVVGYPVDQIHLDIEDLQRRNILGYDEMTDSNLDTIRKTNREMQKKIESDLGINRIDKYKGTMKQTPRTDSMGFFVPNYGNFGNYGIEQPAIFMCMQNISNEAQDHNEFMYLNTLVLMHEIGHYVMKNKSDYSPRDEFYYWMEESLANCITLSMLYNVLDIHFFDDDDFYHRYDVEYLRFLGKHNINQLVELFDYSKEFILNQEKNYQAGYYLFLYGQTRDYDYSFYWRNSKEKLVNFRTTEKQVWLNYVKNEMIADTGKQLGKYYNAIFHNINNLSLEDIEKVVKKEKQENEIRLKSS